MVDETGIEYFLKRKYAQIVLYVLLESSDHTETFGGILGRVNQIVESDTEGAIETFTEGEYSESSLSDLLEEAEKLGIIEQHLEDRTKKWRLLTSELSENQIETIHSYNRSGVQHTDGTGRVMDFYSSSHTDHTTSM